MNKILLDMDGVLADFIGGICEHHGKDNPYAKGNNLGNWSIDKYWGMSMAEFWWGVDEVFWTNLSPTKEAKDIVKFCVEKVGMNNLCLLTAPPDTEYAYCVMGKRRWLKNIFGSKFRFNMLFGTAKQFCAAENHILIDDADHNVDAFREAGGKAILVPRPWNSLHDSKLSVMEHIQQEWERLNESKGDSGGIGASNGIKRWVQMCLPLSR